MIKTSIIRKVDKLVKSGLCLAGFVALIGGAQAQESTSFQINPAHTGGLSTAAGFAPPLNRLWTVDLYAPITYPLVAQNMVIVNYLDESSNNILDVVSAKTGHRLWKKTYPAARNISYAAYDNGLVFELSASGILQAFQASNGNIVWAEQFTSDYIFGIPPVASGGFVYLTAPGGTVYQITAQTGQVLWSASTSSQTSASIVSGKAFVTDTCNVEALSLLFGTLIWNKGAGSTCYSGFNVNAPAIPVGNFVFVPQYYDYGTATIYNAKTGAVVRTSNSGVPALLNGLEYQESNLGIQASKISNGDILWTTSFPNAAFQVTPIVVDGAVYALSTGSTLYALDAKKGTILQEIAAGRANDQVQFSGVTGLGAGQGILVVPSGNQLIAFAPVSPGPAKHHPIRSGILRPSVER